MKFDKSQLLLYGVTDRAWSGKKSLTEQVEEALRAGVTMLQIREKDMPEQEFRQEIMRMKTLTDRYHVPLIVNDDVESALCCGADGVHVGQCDMEAGDARMLLGPDKILGVTVKTPEQAVIAQAGGADYLGAGAVFGSSTKTDAKYMDFETLKAICQAVTIPVVAIGGINENNMLELKGSGVYGAAVVSAIFAQKEIPEAVGTLLNRANEMMEDME